MDFVKKQIDSGSKLAGEKKRIQKKKDLKHKHPNADAKQRRKDSNNASDAASREAKKYRKQTVIKQIEKKRLEVAKLEHNLGGGSSSSTYPH
ncbi:hypothetical protein FGB62_5g149 [Gracilaria domingensis]|nr:hypothetical protein FGB62_5g149 [Gracilaria domingensis]